MQAQIQPTRAIGRTPFRPRSRPARNIHKYGFREEEKFLGSLRGDKGFAVHHNLELDEIYKLDAVVRDLDRPHLPAVGVQFTTKQDPEKEERTFAAVRRHLVVTRLLYLVAECPLQAEATPMIRELVRQTAQQPAAKAVVFAVLSRDESGRCYFRFREELPLETKYGSTTRRKERGKSDETKNTGSGRRNVDLVGVVFAGAGKRDGDDQLSRGTGGHLHRPVRLRLAESVRAEPDHDLSARATGDEPERADRRDDRARVIGHRTDAEGGGKVWRIARAA